MREAGDPGKGGGKREEQGRVREGREGGNRERERGWGENSNENVDILEEMV